MARLGHAGLRERGAGPDHTRGSRSFSGAIPQGEGRCGPLIGRDDLVRLMEKILSFRKGFEIQVNIVAEDIGLTRFYRNQIHQNLRRQDHAVSITVVKDKRIGVSSVNQLDEGSLRWAVQTAVDNMEASEPNEDFPGLPRPEPVPDVQTYFSPTAGFRPRDRALGCGEAIRLARANDMQVSGTFVTVVREVACASSMGVVAYNASTEASFRTVFESGDITGYADRISRDVRDINCEAVAAEAVHRVRAFREAIDLPAGRYDTVFQEYAVADLIRFLGYLGFGALAKQQGRSFMAHAMGKRIMGENVTIWDDGLDTRGLAVPFDAEGVPKKKVVLIDRGVACGVVYDSATAAKEGVRSTGHASSQPYRSGPMPSNMFMATGEASLEDMIASTKRGLLVTRFHYTHCPEPVRVVATGTTRDGTFLIEDGRLVARVKNLRFTESVLEAFSRIDAISATARITRDWWGTFASVLPSIRIRDFNFTGSTSF